MYIRGYRCVETGMAEAVEFIAGLKMSRMKRKFFELLSFFLLLIFLLWIYFCPEKDKISILTLMISSCSLFFLIINFNMTTAIFNLDREPALRITEILTDPDSERSPHKLPLTLGLLNKSKVVIREILVQIIVVKDYTLLPEDPSFQHEDLLEIPKILPDEKLNIVYGKFNLLDALRKDDLSILCIGIRVLYKNPLTKKDEQDFDFKGLQREQDEFNQVSHNKFDERITKLTEFKNFLERPLSEVRKQSRMHGVHS